MKNINQLETEEKPKSSRNMTLKQAYNLYKKATRFAEGIENLKKGNFTDEESIKLIISSFSFIFNMKKIVINMKRIHLKQCNMLFGNP